MSYLSKTAAIMAGSFILSIGLNGMLVPNHLLDGGVIGIALIMNYLWGLKVGLSIILCSIPIYIFAWFRCRPFFYNSLLGLLVSSFFIDLFDPLQNYFTSSIQLPPLSSSIAGGLLVGSGIGIMLRYRTSTGGTDLMAQFLAELTSINVGILIFLIDACVVGLGGFLLSSGSLFLSILTICFVGIATSLWTWRRNPAADS